MSEVVAIIAAHPDDEVLGCGGTAIAHSKRGDEVHVLIMSEGVTSRDQSRNISKRADELAAVKTMAMSAGNLMGVKTVNFAGFPDNRMDDVNLLEVIKVVEKFITSLMPRRIYTHHGGDLNIDHRITHQAVVTASRPCGVHTPTLLFFETLSSTEWAPHGSFPPFLPNWYQDITETLERKIAALEIYTSEIRPWPHPRSLEGVKTLAKIRGSQMQVNAAEAFVVGRVLSRTN